MIRLAIAAVLVLVAGHSWAQHQQPYAGLAQRPVKALSDEQIVDLRAGRGMSLALAAELNGYPGPVHVLEHSDALMLTPEQNRRTRELFQAMKAEAVPLGERLIAQETALDRAFAGRTITPRKLAEAMAAIGTTQGELRATHLKYHLSQAAILTPQQLRRYAELRGYAPGGEGGSGSHRGHSHSR
jgi:hypothetical protein